MRGNSVQLLPNGMRVFRDDLYPFLGGGNKGRKMDYIAREIADLKANALVTTGGYQSNHCRAVAVYAAQHQLACTLVMHGSKAKFESETGNAKIMRLSGANIVFVEEASQIGAAMDQAMETYHSNGMTPYYIWGGGHTLAGGLAYIDAVAELKAYCDQTHWQPRYIFHASGTGSTQSGILAGLDLHGFQDTEVIGISVGRKSAPAQTIVETFYHELCEKNGITCQGRKAIVLDDYLMGGYAEFTPALYELSQSSIKTYGFTLDTCYTGKAFYGMQSYLETHQIAPATCLFWHTGGIFNFLAEN